MLPYATCFAPASSLLASSKVARSLPETDTRNIRVAQPRFNQDAQLGMVGTYVPSTTVQSVELEELVWHLVESSIGEPFLRGDKRTW